MSYRLHYGVKKPINTINTTESDLDLKIYES